ncbi:MAG: 23S rRNA (uracil(1939)-C(5))-methyltransferase RlmD [Clostridiales bacterium]|jgi:23S rRNA (uracil-5-)-methyltransferase RumA|nr:23S rRNA (uracil(1939)-C(5))-methyltransferase RlmD [Clostridiales bacterium]
MAKKHQIIEVDIEKIEFPDFGLGFYEGARVLVRQGLPGERVRARVFKIKAGNIHAKTEEVLRESPLKIAPDCALFGSCGGCAYQHIRYRDELLFKETMVRTLLDGVLTAPYDFQGIVPAPSPAGYRNKMEYTFGDEEKGGALCLGMRKKGSFYEAVNVRPCKIAPADFGEILQTTLDFFKATPEQFYHRMKQTGTLRNLVLRKGFFTDEILVNLVTTSDLKTDLSPWAEAVLKCSLSGKIAGILHTVNNSPADAVKMDALRTLYGQDCLTEKLCGLSFKISPFSFFQTNSRGAALLYATAKEFAGDCTDQILFDLYCGTGTIAQMMSAGAKKVTGIELVAEAVEAAKENAERNKIDNCDFIAGDVLAMVDCLAERPDTIILDPPREGIHPKAIKKIIAFGAPTLVYISCKPTSLAQDLAVFTANGYRVVKVKCHDMFPRTGHVETVVLLRRKTMYTA